LKLHTSHLSHALEIQRFSVHDMIRTLEAPDYSLVGFPKSRPVSTESIAFVAVAGGDPKGISTLATAIRDVFPR
jgi:hypothetical protein